MQPSTEKSASATSVTSSSDWDEHWEGLSDFIRYNPGARHRRRIVRELLAPLRFESVLDAGCGNGEFLAELAEQRGRQIRYVGTDFTADTLQANARKLPFAAFRQLDLEKGRLDEQFDLVTCCEVVEHLNDRPSAFTNLHAMVRPGGHLLVTAPAGRIFPTERHWGHTTHPDAAEIRGYARRDGMEIVALKTWGAPMYFFTKVAANLNPEYSIKTFGTESYSPAAKLLNNALYYLNFLNLTDSPWGCQLFALLRKPA